MTDATMTATCTACGCERKTKPRADGTPAIPKGWREFGGEVLCPACKAARYVTRVISLPVAAPLDGEWKELREALREAFRTSRMVANTIVQELFKAEPPIEPGATRLPPVPKVDVYGAVRDRFPDYPSHAVTALIQRVTAVYMKERFAVLIAGKRSLRSYRDDGIPFVAKGATVGLGTVGEGAGEALTVAMRIGTRRWTLKLRGGHRHERHAAILRRVISGELRNGDVMLQERPCGATHRNGGETRANGGGARWKTDLMVRVVVTLPAEARRNEGVLVCGTGEDCLLWATHNGERIWALHEDHLPRRIAAYQDRLHRLSDDRKAEQRPPHRSRASLQDQCEVSARRMKRALNSVVQRAAAALVGFARRRGCGRIALDDSERGYLPSFPWAALRRQIESKCKEFGVSFECQATSDAQEEIADE